MSQRSVPQELLSEVDTTSELLRRRDPKAVAELLARYRPMLRAIVAGEIEPALRSKVDPSDVVQEVCVEVIKSFDQIRTTQSTQFLAYLRQVLASKLQDLRRRYITARKRDTKLERPWDGKAIEDPLAARQNQETHLDQMIEAELLERTLVAIGELPYEIRKVLQMRFFDDLTYAAIGQQVSRSEDDVRMLIKRSIKKLRQQVLPLS